MSERSFGQKVTILLDDPVVELIGETKLVDNTKGWISIDSWLQSRRPECGFEDTEIFAAGSPADIGLHRAGGSADLVELAGRKCYNSFGAKAGRREQKDYLSHLWEVGHESVFYHAKFSFFVAGISRRLLQELIRHHVGTDRDVEGSPSVESTRFVKFNGFYVAHPADIPPLVGSQIYGPGQGYLRTFIEQCQRNFDDYLDYVDCRLRALLPAASKPTSLQKKRIYEAASQRLCQGAETSLIWTSNPVALMKMFKQRSDVMADLEFQRLAKKWHSVCHEWEPTLFPSLELPDADAGLPENLPELTANLFKDTPLFKWLRRTGGY